MLLLAKIVNFVKSKYFYADCYAIRSKQEFGWNKLNKNEKCEGYIIDTKKYPCKYCPYYEEERKE